MFIGTKRDRYLLLLEMRAKLADVEGEVSRTFGVISKTPKRFCIYRNLKSNGPICYKLPVLVVSGHRGTGSEFDSNLKKLQVLSSPQIA